MQTLKQLGDNLRMSRKKHYPHDDMSTFALRVGVSRANVDISSCG